MEKLSIQKHNYCGNVLYSVWYNNSIITAKNGKTAYNKKTAKAIYNDVRYKHNPHTRLAVDYSACLTKFGYARLGGMLERTPFAFQKKQIVRKINGKTFSPKQFKIAKEFYSEILRQREANK